MNRSSGYVYALVDPDTDEVRYVGRTGGLQTRFKIHLSDAVSPDKASNPRKAHWLAGLRKQGKEPGMRVLDRYGNGLGENWEREAYWTFVMASEGHTLLSTDRNITELEESWRRAKHFSKYHSAGRYDGPTEMD